MLAGRCAMAHWEALSFHESAALGVISCPGAPGRAARDRRGRSGNRGQSRAVRASPKSMPAMIIMRSSLR